ncbi:hypothetical protein B7R54_12235 [Subtercola boreus]|uniref:Uncharacterized protein n=1 Tax=Subtercola boreus TaxID=120213 RepID=A0A3E0VJS6_9MICO|nr:protealysin inhibitor emfourin [Subtercola boreus]RFA09885.1 hypothetical protein B7R54_12235 [Subtercola boreus]TQL52984.1 hypothetical protein FB464_0475 [Subtercola boreus]
MEQPADTSGPRGQSPQVAVTVVRTGGFAGLKRTWEATADDPSTVDVWLGYVDALPWGKPPQQDPHSADRFVYRIVIAVRSEVRHDQTLPESALTGGWRDLVERVQHEAGGDQDAAPTSPGG